jgi:cell division protein FtsL
MLSDLPGWDSLPTVSRNHSVAEIAGIIVLGALVAAEVVAYKYGKRKDFLTEQQQHATEQRHDEEMARLHLETAQANKATEELRQENLDLRTKIAGRRVKSEQYERLVLELSKNPGFFHMQAMTDGESALYAADLFKTLKAAQWTSDTPEFPLGTVWHGLVLFQTDDPAALRIAEALKAADIPFLIGDAQHKKERATLMVGAKPPPF